MTHMRPNPRIFEMPRKSDIVAVEAHRDAVLDHFSDIFDEIDSALRDALPKVKSTFALHEGPVDLAVHAPWTRYLVRLGLSKNRTEIFDEEDVEYALLRVSNCGLCLRTSQGDIRILKSPGDGLPKALSDARVRFVTNNQLAFSFAEGGSIQLDSINLFVLWKMDGDHQYLGMDIACPREAQEKGDIDCHWITPWRRADGIQISKPVVPVAPDLDEIVAIPARDKNISK